VQWKEQICEKTEDNNLKQIENSQVATTLKYWIMGKNFISAGM
jgi:hypothetical protein